MPVCVRINLEKMPIEKQKQNIIDKYKMKYMGYLYILQLRYLSHSAEKTKNSI